MITDLPPPPQNTKYVERQAGGHCADNGDNVLPNLQHVDGTFLKFLRESPRYLKELRFYQDVFLDDDFQNVEDIIHLKTFLPKFHGIFLATIGSQEIKYLKLEDITHKYRFPCLLDVKMKADIHDPCSTNAHQSFLPAQQMRFLVDGLQVYDKKANQYISYHKTFGRSLTIDGVHKALMLYTNAKYGNNRPIVDSFLLQLKNIRNWAAKQKTFKFYRSSLLFVYDANYFEDIRWHEHFSSSDCNKCSNLTDLRLVDFSKVYTSKETDIDFLIAVENLIRCFQKLF